MEDLSIVNIGELITLRPGYPHSGAKMDDIGILKDVSISIKDGKISGIGKAKTTKVEIDAQGKVVMPGFIDSHTHLVFAGSRADEFELRLKGKTYKEIKEQGGGIISTVMSTRKTTASNLFNSAVERLNYAIKWGTTTMEVKSGYGLSLQDEIKILKVIKKLNEAQPLSLVSTFLGAHEVPPEKSKKEYINDLLNEIIPKVSKLAKFCDVFCEHGVFTKEEARKILEVGKKFELLPKIHADELSESGGAELAGELGAVSADHVIHPSTRGIKLMKKAGTVVVILPGTCLFLEHKPPIKKLMDADIPIAIGSDFNPGTSTILAMPIIMSIACTLLKLTPAQAITAATINAAYAVGLGDRIGSIEIGKDADILVLSVDFYNEIPYWIGFNPVKVVIKKGRVV